MLIKFSEDCGIGFPKRQTILEKSLGTLLRFWGQRAKKEVSDSPRLVDFSIGLVNSVLNLPDGQVKYFEQFNLHKNCEINSAHQNIWGLVEMTFGLVSASYSLPEWQGVKMTFFAPWGRFPIHTGPTPPLTL